MMRRMLLALAALGVVGPAAAAQQEAFELKSVAPGVTLALARPQFVANSNGAIVELDDAVLVVDTHSSPAAARALIRQIGRLTPKPVRYVVNTHFHYDHWQGNEAYTGVWPAGIDIISSETTRERLAAFGATRAKALLAGFDRQLALLRQRRDTTEDAAARARLADSVQAAEAAVDGLRRMELVLPTLTFDRSLVLRRGAAEVHLLFLGRGHTDGDVVVFLPRERVLIAGDLLTASVPVMGDSHPYDWIRTLEALQRLDFDVVLSGHGDVLRGKETVQLWIDYFRALMEATAAAAGDGLDLAAARDRVVPLLRERFAARFPAAFPSRVPAHVDRAWQVVTGRNS